MESQWSQETSDTLWSPQRGPESISSSTGQDEGDNLRAERDRYRADLAKARMEYALLLERFDEAECKVFDLKNTLDRALAHRLNGRANLSTAEPSQVC